MSQAGRQAAAAALLRYEKCKHLDWGGAQRSSDDWLIGEDFFSCPSLRCIPELSLPSTSCVSPSSRMRKVSQRLCRGTREQGRESGRHGRTGKLVRCLLAAGLANPWAGVEAQAATRHGPIETLRQRVYFPQIPAVACCWCCYSYSASSSSLFYFSFLFLFLLTSRPAGTTGSCVSYFRYHAAELYRRASMVW